MREASKLDEQGPKENIDILNKEIPGNDFKEPMSFAKAHFLDQIKKDKAEAELKLKNSMNTTFSKIGGVLGGMLSTAADPIDFLVGYISGGVGGKAATALTGKASVYWTARFLGDATANLGLEEVVGAAKEQIGEEYTFDQKLFNASFSAVLGLGIEAGIQKAVSSYIGRDQLSKNAKIIKEATENGNDPTRALNALDAEIKTKIEIDDPLTESIENIFGERSNLIFKEADDILQVRENLIELESKGVISTDELSMLEKDLLDKGYDKIKAFQEDPEFKISDDTRKTIEETISPNKTVGDEIKMEVDEISKNLDTPEEIKYSQEKLKNDTLEKEILGEGKEKFFTEEEINNYKVAKEETIKAESEINLNKMASHCLGIF
jgi:hypothetical protein